MCSHNWALPHPAAQTGACILLSGWDLCLLEQEAVPAPNDTGSYSPGDRCTLPQHQRQGAQILLWLPWPWPSWSCETR